MPQTTLSLAKTTQPTLSMVLNRERIFKKIDSGPNTRAIWITGPPGSGKTTTIASYLAANNHMALWYQLDSTDTDIPTFFYYLSRTALKHCNNPDASIGMLVESQDIFNYANRLFRSIFSSYKTPLIIVFDNFDSILSHSDLHKILASAINEVPEHSKLVFVSRYEPSPPFARAQINQLLTIIDGRDLILDEQEVSELARIREFDLTEAELKEVFDVSAGWITGFIHALEYAKRFGKFPDNILRNKKNLIFDYVAEEIFSNFDEVTKRFLLKVCWPRRLTIKMAKTLGDEPKSHNLLSNLALNNYFVTEREEEKEIEYILHPLLREFLQNQSRRLMKESEITTLQKKTAELLLYEEQPEEAVELLCTIHDWEQLELTILSHASLLQQQGRYSLLTQWLDELPVDRLNNNAWLLYWYGKSRQTESPREARNYFESAYKYFDNNAKNDLKGIILSCSGIIEAIISGCDDYSLLDTWINLLINHLPSETDFLEKNNLVFVDITILIALVLRNEKNNEISNWFERADQAIQKIPFNEIHYRYKLFLILAYILTGQFKRANDLLLSLQKNNGLRQDYPVLTCRYFLLDSLNAFLQGNGHAARQSAEAAQSLVEEYAIDNLLPYVYASQYGAAINDGNLVKADEWLTGFASVISNNNRLLQFILHYYQSWYALLNNEIIKSYHEQKQAQSCASELGITLLEVLSSTALAQLLFLCNDSGAGEAQLRRVHSIARDIKNPLLEFMTLLIYGDVAIHENRASSGINALRYALGLGRTNEYYYMPWWNPEQLSEIFSTALRNKIEHEYVRNFITLRNLETFNPPVDLEEWPWYLQIHTFGGLTLNKSNNEKIEDSKGQGKPSRLLKILIALGGQRVSAKKTAEILWPHVDTDYGNKSLTINLHRLRKILGNDEIIHLRDGYLSLNPALAWLDMFALEKVSDQINNFMITTKHNYNTTEMDNHIVRLMRIYQGPFLDEEDDMQCIVSTRDRLQSIFHKCLVTLVDIANKHKDLDRIIELYEEGIKRAPSVEEFYYQLMVLYHNQSKYKDVTEVFNRCCMAMANTSQDKPSEKTLALYKSYSI